MRNNSDDKFNAVAVVASVNMTIDTTTLHQRHNINVFVCIYMNTLVGCAGEYTHFHIFPVYTHVYLSVTIGI